MKYNKWDRVRIKEHKDTFFTWKYTFVGIMRDYCWEVLTIEVVYNDHYILEEVPFCRTDDMIEEKVVEFKKWEVVEVKDENNESWEKRIFLCEIPWKEQYPYLCIHTLYEEEYKKWLRFQVTSWEKIRKIKELPEYTIEELQEKLWEKFKIKK